MYSSDPWFPLCFLRNKDKRMIETVNQLNDRASPSGEIVRVTCCCEEVSVSCRRFLPKQPLHRRTCPMLTGEEISEAHDLCSSGRTKKEEREAPLCRSGTRQDKIFSVLVRQGAECRDIGNVVRFDPNLRKTDDGVESLSSDVSSISNDSLERYGNKASTAGVPQLSLAQEELRFPVESRDPIPIREIQIPAVRIPSVRDRLLSDDVISTSGWARKRVGLKRGHSLSGEAVFRGETSIITEREGRQDTSRNAFLGNRVLRRQQKQRLRNVTALSTGRLVGQSNDLSPNTARTSLWSLNRSDHSCPDIFQSTGGKEVPVVVASPRADGGDNLAPKRRPNPVKQEMLHVLGKVTKPVKNLMTGDSGSRNNNCKFELRRSKSGCLT